MSIGKNKLKMLKKALCLIFAFLLSINSFAAVVLDNDGSAFITKAEFEALKSNFADQVDNYNNSIDNKIDGSIASYLAGIQLSKKEIIDDYVTSLYKINNWATCFVDKNTKTGSSNNNQYFRGGWWLFYIGGWNTAWVQYNKIININNHAYNDHRLTLVPSSVNSKKYYVTKWSDGSNTYYGPYNSVLYDLEQQVFVQKVDSTWDDGTNYSKSQISRPTHTFDLTALSTSGSTNVGSYNAGWHTWSDIVGTIILKYDPYNYNERKWGCENATSGASTDSSNVEYCIDYEYRNTLNADARTESSTITGTYGSQFQIFNARSGTAAGGGQDTANSPAISLKFKTPKILSFKNAELCNITASKFINEKVAVYAGLPVTRLPGNGKITLKWKATAKNLSTNVDSAENIKIAFKTKQFKNGAIGDEDVKDIAFEKDNAESGTVYTSEFEIFDAKLDGTTVLYVKCTPTNASSYVRFEIADSIIFVGE